jgi:hypothetical protein
LGSKVKSLVEPLNVLSNSRIQLRRVLDEVERQLIAVKPARRRRSFATCGNAGGNTGDRSCDQNDYYKYIGEALCSFFHAPHFSTARRG